MSGVRAMACDGAAPRAYGPSYRRSNRRSARAFLVLAVSLGSVACGPGPPDRAVPVQPDDPLAALLDSAFGATPDVPGALLRVEGAARRFMWEGAVGVADPASGSELRSGHALRLASLTKTYVAAAVLRLAEDGVVDLGDPIVEHLLPSTVLTLEADGYDPAAITLSMLLRHTGGLFDYATEDVFVQRILAEPRHRWSREEQLRLAMEIGDPVGGPGERFHYSDTGYILLGEVIEQVTGSPLGAALRRLLAFDALGLTATWMESVEPEPRRAPPRAHQHLGTLDTYGFDPSFDLFGGGGLVATLGDVSTFFRALFDGRVFRDRATLDAMVDVTPESLAVMAHGYGMGMARVEYADMACYGHGGFWGILVRYCPEADVLVAGAVTSTSGRTMLEEAVAEAARLMSTRDTAPASALSSMITGRMEAHDVPGLNVLVIRGGNVRWLASFGWADVASGRPMTSDAVFRVESISKPVTAWGVVKLVESGLLDPDAPVQAQLRDRALPPDAGSVTPRQLLSHTAGLGLGDYNARYAPDGPVPTLSESLEAELTMVGPPGDAFSYSDTGYNLLELLVQDVTGEDFGRWMDRNVLDPLGMVEASFDWNPALRDRVPTAYTLRGRPVAPYVYPGRGSGGLFATIEDVGRFAEASMAPTRNRVRERLDDSSIARLHTSVVRPGGLYGFVAEGYGLGHFTETLSDGRRAVWHGGQGFGWMTHVHLVPETGDAIVLLANSQRAWPLFGHVLRAWSESLGVEPVRMARIVWAAPLAWLIIGACLFAAAILVARAVLRRRTGVAAGNGSRTGLAIRAVAVLIGLGLLAAVAWASVQDYLFLFSILPATTAWLGVAVGVFAVGLLAWALMPGSRSRVVGAGLVALILSGGAQGLGAQEALIHLEGSWLPTSDVTRTLSGPATEARVTMARGSVLVPLLCQGERLLVVPRISGSRVGVAPRPLDPAEPVWVEALYDLDLEVISLLTLSERTRLSLVLAPGMASDFRGVSSDHVTLQGAALLTREAASGPTWGGGVSVTNAFGEVRLVPLLALQWRGERVYADILAPAHGEVFWTPSDRIATGLQAMVDGNVYGLGREGTLEGGLVRYSLADVGPVIRYDIGRRLRVSASVGVSLRRRLEVEDARGTQIENAALSRGWRIGFGVSWLVPEGGG